MIDISRVTKELKALLLVRFPYNGGLRALISSKYSRVLIGVLLVTGLLGSAFAYYQLKSRSIEESKAPTPATSQLLEELSEDGEQGVLGENVATLTPILTFGSQSTVSPTPQSFPVSTSTPVPTSSIEPTTAPAVTPKPTDFTSPTLTPTQIPFPSLIPSQPLIPTEVILPLQANFSISGLRHTENFKKEAPACSQGEVFRGDTVTFDASNSTGNIMSYEWSFGDGLTGTGKTVSHTYNAPTAPIIYMVKLTVIDLDKNTNDTSLCVYYIGEPRMLISLERVPDIGLTNIPCGQFVDVKANAYSPWGEITEVNWEIMRGSVSFKRASDLILRSVSTSENHQVALNLECAMVVQDAALQVYTDGYAVYSFAVREFRDSVGNKITYSDADTFAERGTLTITSYKP